jgi:hypothetical protein
MLRKVMCINNNCNAQESMVYGVSGKYGKYGVSGKYGKYGLQCSGKYGVSGKYGKYGLQCSGKYGVSIAIQVLVHISHMKWCLNEVIVIATIFS